MKIKIALMLALIFASLHAFGSGGMTCKTGDGDSGKKDTTSDNTR